MRRQFLIVITLVAVTSFVYWQVRTFDFVNFDDFDYVVNNPHVLSGPSWENVRWAFTTNYVSMWHPLTWVSLMVDAGIYGSDAGGYHTTNFVLHLANVLLLFLVLQSMTGATGRSAFVAALFAVHPLHVESVAWITERKDVLSMFFGLLALGGYSQYARRPAVAPYGFALVAYVASLFTKPMLVTLPFVFLLLDYWPLRRVNGPIGFGRSSSTERARETPRAENESDAGPAPEISPQTWKRLLSEKLPFLAASLYCCVMTYRVEDHGGALPSLDAYPFHVRLSNAIDAYVLYIAKAVWPQNLAAYYPHPGDSLSGIRVAGCALLLLLVTFGALRMMRRRPYIAVGWLWYLGTLVPMIGLVQVGNYRLADRFTYMPLIGLYILVSWLGQSFVSERPGRKIVMTAAALSVVVALAVTARQQTATWRNSVTLFTHAIAVTRGNAVAHTNLGVALEELHGATGEAYHHYRRALAVDADHEPAHSNLGILLLNSRRPVEALPYLERAQELVPDAASTNGNLGAVLLALGRIDDAMRHYRRAVELAPETSSAHVDLGNALWRKGNNAGALECYETALRLEPANADAKRRLQFLQQRAGNTTSGHP